MDIKEIDYVIAINEQKNITKAAETLYISQPSLSRYLNNIESRIGTKLFEREKEGMIPTETGKIYLRYAYRIRQLSKEMNEQIITSVKQVAQTIRVGLVQGGDIIPLLNKKMEFEKKNPDCHIRFMNINYNDYQEKLDSPDYDYYVGPKAESKDFIAELISKEKVLFAVNETQIKEPVFSKIIQSDGEKSWIDLKHAEGLPLLVQEKYCRITEKLSWILDTYPQAFKIKGTVINSSLALDAVKSGIGVAFVLNSYNKPSAVENVHFYEVLNPPLKLNVFINRRKQHLMTQRDLEFSYMMKSIFNIEP